jgi:hypothetical protein
MARRAALLYPLPGRRLLAGSAVTVLALLPGLPAAAANHQPSAHRHPHSIGSGLHASDVSCSEPAHRQCIVVSATGFLAGERVLARELRRPAWQQVLVADRRGVIRYRFVPQSHSDVLTFVGQGRSTRPTGSGNVAVSVPRIAVYRCPS